MTRSANEVMGLAAKAARGAGAPPAQAAHFGRAAVVHLCAGHGVAALDGALAALPKGPILDLPLAIAQIAEDAVEGRARGALAHGSTPLAQSYGAALPYQAEVSRDGILTLDLTRPAMRGTVQRLHLPQETYEAWSRYAAAMLVPESDASRLSGAGAGLSDND